MLEMILWRLEKFVIFLIVVISCLELVLKIKFVNFRNYVCFMVFCSVRFFVMSDEIIREIGLL